MSKKTSNPYKSVSNKQSTAAAAQAERTKLRNKKAFVISLISLITVVVITVTLIIALYVPETKTEITNKTPTAVVDTATVKNGSFNYVYNDSMLQYPYVAKNWTVKNDTVKSLIGVIDTAASDWSKVQRNLKQYGINNVANPGVPSVGDDSRALIIYNNEATKTSATVSSAISIAANTYLEVSVWVKTIDIRGANAYIGIKDYASADEFIDTLEFSNINTNGVWQQYTFLIEADNTTRALWLEIGLDTSDATSVSGLVFFDNAIAESTRKSDYIAQVYDAASANPVNSNTFAYTFTTKNTDEIVTPINNTLSKTAVSPSLVSQITNQYYHNNIDENLPFYYYDENGKDLMITQLSVPTSVTSSQIYPNNATNANYLQISLDPTLVGPSINDAFQISFWMLTKGLQPSTSANIYLTATDTNGKVSSSVQFSGVTSSTDIKNDKLGGWKQYTLFVKASDILDYKVSIEIYLGSKDFTAIPTYGNLFITDIKTEKISYDKYSSNSDSTTVKKVDVSSIASEYTSGNNLLANPSFNTPATNENPVNSVYQPYGWRLITSIYDNQTTKPQIQNGIKKLDAKDSTTAGPNGLYISSNGPTALGYISSDITLSANSYYVFSVYAYGNSSVYLTSKPSPSSDVSISQSMSRVSASGNFDYNGLTLTSSQGKYTQYVFIVATGYTALTVNFELWLGGKDEGQLCNANDYVVFDNVSASSITLDQYKTLYTKGSRQAFNRVEQISIDKDSKEETVTAVYVESMYSNVVVVDLSASDKAPVVDEEDDDNEEEDTTTPPGIYEPFDWLILGSLIFSVVLLIAVISFLVRKFRKSKRNHEKPTNQYDPDNQ